MSKKFTVKDWMKIRKELDFDEHKIRFKPIVNENDYINAMSAAADALRKELEKRMFNTPPFATGGRVYGNHSYYAYANEPFFDFTGYKSPDGERMDIDCTKFKTPFYEQWEDDYSDPSSSYNLREDLTTPQKMRVTVFLFNLENAEIYEE